MHVSEIIDFLVDNNIEHKVCIDGDFEIDKCCSLFDLKDNALTWIRFIEDIDLNEFNKVNDTLLIADICDEADLDINVIYVKDVHSVFFQIVDCLFSDLNPNSIEPKIEETAIVLTNDYGKNLYVGHNTYIGRDVIIGNNVRILNNVSIQGKVRIGNDCFVESNTVIGATGYGHYVDNKGITKTVPHISGVEIADRVEVGCNCCIERGCLAATVIEEGVFIDNLSHIGHNVHIKKGTMIVGAKIGGSTTVGENVWVGFNTVVSDQIVVGDNSYIGMGSAVTKDVPENKVMVGVPARVLRNNTDESKIKHKNREKE